METTIGAAMCAFGHTCHRNVLFTIQSSMADGKGQVSLFIDSNANYC
jgi:hypothetical protein